MAGDPTFWENALQGWVGAVVGSLIAAMIGAGAAIWVMNRTLSAARRETKTQLEAQRRILAEQVQEQHEEAARRRLVEAALSIVRCLFGMLVAQGSGESPTTAAGMAHAELTRLQVELAGQDEAALRVVRRAVQSVVGSGMQMTDGATSDNITDRVRAVFREVSDVSALLMGWAAGSKDALTELAGKYPSDSKE